MKKYLLSLLLSSQLFSSDMAFDLASHLGTKDANWVFSPLSISSCLSMVHAGAQGETAEEMAPFLSDLGSSEEIEMAQGVWIKEGFSILPAYQALLKEQYGALIESASFTPDTIEHINTWVGSATHQKIQDLLSPGCFSDATRMVLVNALYFQGTWLRPFPAYATRTDTFYTSKEPVFAAFMKKNDTVPYFANDSFQAIALPFATNTICLLILPEPGFELASKHIQAALEGAADVEVDIQVPKFEIAYDCKLNLPLQKMGMKKVFTQDADLSGINGARDLFLSDILHKSYFAFQEKGVEAAAATAAILSGTCCRTASPLYSFCADRPFYFVLMNPEQGTIFFLGYIQNPNS